MARYAHVTGWGMAVPERVLTNLELESMVDTDDEWIVSRTGIRERRIADKHDSTATLATRAARRALESADVGPEAVDLIIVASASPEHLFPATACLVQDALGAAKAGAFDLSAACSGFIFAVQMASQAVQTGAIDTALVIGSETLSRLINWEDRSTAILFGDGAGAFVLEARETPGGILAGVMRSDGSGGGLLTVQAGGSRFPASHETVERKQHTITMNGREVFRFATHVMASATREVVKKAGLQMDDIEVVVPHQANLRIIEAAARGLRLPMERFVVNIERYGNTSSASIPIAVCEAVHAGRIKPGDHVVLVGFGAGLTWGAIALQWMETERRVSRTRRGRIRLRGLLARLRATVMRVVRRLEGLIWGAANDPKG
jgi:3-oxoacyl-[acyl-carrier-protein] synthase III